MLTKVALSPILDTQEGSCECQTQRAICRQSTEIPQMQQEYLT